MENLHVLIFQRTLVCLMMLGDRDPNFWYYADTAGVGWGEYGNFRFFIDY